MNSRDYHRVGHCAFVELEPLGLCEWVGDVGVELEWGLREESAMLLLRQ